MAPGQTVLRDGRLGLLVAIALGVLVTTAGVAHATGAPPERVAQTTDGSSVRDVEGTALGNVYRTNETPTFRVNASGTIEWRVENYWNETVASGSHDASDDDPTTITVERSTPGYYELTVGSGDRAITRSFAIVRPHDFSRYEESIFAVQGSFGRRNPLEIVPLVETVGAKTVRGGRTWMLVEPERGTFTYTERQAREMAAYERHDLEPFFVIGLGNTLYYEPAAGLSGWDTHFTAPYNEAGREAYARFAREIVTRYSDLPTVEIWNEPNWRHFSRGPASEDPVAYATLLSTASPKIRGARSNVTILGGSTAGLAYNWIETVLQHGGAEHMDAIAIHPYRRQFAPEVDGRYAHGNLEQELNDLQNLTAEYNDGEPLPIWITEYGYLTGGPKAVSVPQQTTYLPRSYVLAQAAGVERFSWFQFRAQQTGNGLIRYPDSPLGGHNARPAYVSYATMTRQLSGATPQGRERVTIENHYLPRSTIADRYYSYRYEGRDGQALRVAWSLQPATAILETEEALTVTDLMGRRRTVEPTDGTVTLELSGQPLYVEGSIEEFRVSVPERYRRPLDASISLPEPADESALERQATIDLRIRNNLESGSATIDAIEWSTNGRTGTVRPGERVGAGDETTLSIPLSGIDTWEPYRSYDVSVRVDFADGRAIRTNRTVMFDPVPARSLRIDGRAADGRDLPTIQLPEQGSVDVDDADYGGPADLSADARVTWDRERLYFQAIVTDDTHDQPADAVGQAWKGDSIQFAVSQGGPGEYLRFSQYTIALNASGVPQLTGIDQPLRLANDPETAEYTVRRDQAADRTVYEVAIPWREIYGFESAPERFSFTFLVNDNDGAGRKGWIEWGAGIGATSNTDYFNAMEAVDAGGTPPTATEPATVHSSTSTTPTSPPAEKATSTPTVTPTARATPEEGSTDAQLADPDRSASETSTQGSGMGAVAGVLAALFGTTVARRRAS